MSDNNDKLTALTEFTDSITKTAYVKDQSGKLVVKYVQIIEFTDRLTDDDHSFVQAVLDQAQEGFLQSLKDEY